MAAFDEFENLLFQFESIDACGGPQPDRVDAVTAAVRGDTSPAHASADTDPQGDDAVTLVPGSPA